MNPPVGFILGSGWNGITKDLKAKKETPFIKIFGQATTVPGHSGNVVTGSLFTPKLVILSGRYHTYEGYSSLDVTKTIKYLYEQGVKKVIITSACGALNPKYQVGNLVILSDIVTLFCQSPLTGPQFQNLSEPFNSKLLQAAQKSASELNLSYQKGVYAYIKGPHFETFADKMALRFLGADVVGMSTVPEVIMANHLGMRVLGLSLVTNLAFVKHDHRDVLAAVKNQEEKLQKFFLNLIKKL